MRLRHGIGLTVFCLLAGSRWLVDMVWPEAWPPLLGQSLHFALAGVAAVVGVLLQRNNVRERGERPLQTVLAGLLLFAVPALLQQLAPSGGSSVSVALYAMVPLCVVLGMTMVADDTSRLLMMPALAGLAGALLLLPWRLPLSIAEAGAWGLVLAAVVLMALGSVWTFMSIRGRPLLQSVALIALSNAAVLCLCGIVRGERLKLVSSGDGAAMAIDVAQIILFLWLVGQILPEQLASRFFLVPFVTLVEGAVMLRTLPDGRMAVGTLLLLFGAGSLLFHKQDKEVSLRLH